MNPITRRDALKNAAVGSVALGAGGLLTACGSSSGSSSSASTNAASSSGTPRAGGTFTVALTGGSSSDTLNPFSPVSVPSFAYTQCLYDSLVYMTADAQPELALAESITPNKTGTVWTIRLRPGVEFHDGKVMTAEDVIYTFQQVFNPKAPGLSALALDPIDVGGLKALDKYTVEVPCKTPFSTFVETLSVIAYSYIVPVGFDPKHPVGTGPFKLASFNPGQQATLERFPNYWRSGLPYLDKVVMTDFADETSQVNALLAGQADAAILLSTASMKTVQSTPNKVIMVSPGGGFTQFTMRVDRPPFNDVRVRQAMRLVIDRPAMMNTIFAGHGTLGNDVFGIWSSDYDHSLPQRQQDIEQAKSLLKQAGYSDLKTTLVTSDIAQGVVQAAELLAQQASAAGMTISLNQVTPTDFFGPNYLKWVFAQDYSYFCYYLPEVSLVFLPGAFYNETHYSNPAYTKLYNEALAAVDATKRQEIANEMQMIDYTEGSYIIPYFPPVLDGLSANVRGVVPGKSGLSLNSFNLAGVWLA
jgi:peptide/nickel transport system substrate-binding protein